MFTRFTTLTPSLHISRAVQNHLDYLTGDSGQKYFGNPGNKGIDVYENDDHYLLHADLPGFHSSHVDVTLDGKNLRITADRETEKESPETPHLVSRRNMTFRRVLRVPESVDLDKINASLEHGLLSVTLPKRASDKVRKIPINQ